jgi:tetratricopeptide (TPR) repeat protein
MKDGRPLALWALVTASTLAAGAISACKKKETPNYGDPVGDSVGSYAAAGGQLTIQRSQMALGATVLPFTNGLKADGAVARFEDAVLDEGVLVNDTCSGTLEPTSDGVVITIDGDSDCAVFGGRWPFDTSVRLARARTHVAALQFGEARQALTDLHPRDSSGRSEAADFTGSAEMTTGLEWQTLASGNPESAIPKATALANLNGLASEAIRGWLVSHAGSVCADKARRPQCFAFVTAARATALTPKQLEDLARFTEGAADALFEDASANEARGQTEDAMEQFRGVCELHGASEKCAKASARWANLKYAAAQRSYEEQKYLKARSELEAVLTGTVEDLKAKAQRTLESPTLLAGVAVEEAEQTLASSGATDAVVDALKAVCVKGPDTPPCRKSKKLLGEALVQLARKDLEAGQFAKAEARLGAATALGSAAPAAATPMLLEAQTALAWEALAGQDPEKAIPKAVALEALAGVTGEQVRTWMVARAGEACADRAARLRCLAFVRAARGSKLSATHQDELTRHTVAAADVMFTDGTNREAQGRLPEAVELYESVCELNESSEKCAKASSRRLKLIVRVGQREYAAGHYIKAHDELQRVLQSSDEAARRDATRLLEAPTLLAGYALEKAQAELAEKGPSDAVVSSLGAVCVKGPNTLPCTRSRTLTGDVQLQLARGELLAGQYGSAEKRLTALIALGGAAAMKARTLLKEGTFVAGREDEDQRQRADAAIAQCEAGSAECEVASEAALGALGSSPHADRLRNSVAAYRRARADKALARCEAREADCEPLADEALKRLSDETMAQRVRDGVAGFRAAGAMTRCEQWAPDCELIAEAALKMLGESVHAERVKKGLADYRQGIASLPRRVSAVDETVSRCATVNEAEAHAGACFPKAFPSSYNGLPVSPPTFERLGAALGLAVFGAAAPWSSALGLVVLGLLLGLGVGAILGAARQGRIMRGIVVAAATWLVTGGVFLARGGLSTADEAYRRSGISASESEALPPEEPGP